MNAFLRFSSLTSRKMFSWSFIIPGKSISTWMGSKKRPRPPNLPISHGGESAISNFAGD